MADSKLPDGGFLVGQRLLLREVRPSDASEPYYRWVNDPLVTQYLESRFRPTSIDALREYIAKASADPDVLFLAITLRDTRQHIGNVKLGPVNWIHRLAEVGVMIGERDFWGKGYATEAIQLVTQHAFRQLNLHKLTAGCYASNIGSARAFLKAGWHQEGVRKAHFFSDGRYIDLLLFGCVNMASGVDAD